MASVYVVVGAFVVGMFVGVVLGLSHDVNNENARKTPPAVN